MANLQLGLVVRVGDLGVEEELEGGVVFNLRECDVIFIFQYQVFGVLGFRWENFVEQISLPLYHPA